MNIKYKNLDISQNLLIQKYQELMTNLPEFRAEYTRITEKNIESCFRFIIHDLAFKTNSYDFFITNRENYEYMLKKFYQMYFTGTLNFLNGDNFIYIGEFDDPFACDFYNDNLEDR